MLRHASHKELTETQAETTGRDTAMGEANQANGLSPSPEKTDYTGHAWDTAIFFEDHVQDTATTCQDLS